MTRTLPPDPEGMNDDRAAWAAAALRRFRCMTGTDHEDALGDLLCDLMHWSDRHNFDFELALDRARGHYQDETAEEGDTAPDLMELAELVAAGNTEIGRLEQIARAAIAKAKGGAP